MNQSTSHSFDEILDNIDTLSIERQETLIKILQKRLAETRRRQIAQHAAEAHQLYQAGQLPRGSVDDLLVDIENET